jgi:hypothetical protein
MSENNQPKAAKISTFRQRSGAGKIFLGYQEKIFQASKKTNSALNGINLTVRRYGRVGLLGPKILKCP